MINKEIDELLIHTSEFFSALSDYSRFKIIYTLMQKDEMCVSEIVEEVGMSQTSVSYQLKILRQSHIVKYYRKGQNIYYAIDDEHVKEIINQSINHIGHNIYDL